ncbi:helix-turn-helix domain-containing protein [Algoriphagus halophytocola]|uniref:Helix-turn-helix domain-containing protein n=1 Tax=Algoriphagus halophytocola TaxID=2991499 RepID=A0ABY6MKQ5_9BACT|nr:helix-turn-helix transcriptional regulator [Algoriphagus sp. TR-M5]UZD24357.1 helix-turn-helix domain-containing protein [Algoriphagus sp. TR-M5]
MCGNNNQLLSSLLAEIDPIDQAIMNAKMELAAKIATAMDAKGLNNQALQKMMNLSSLQMRKWLSGTHNFTLENLVLLEKALDVQFLNKSL